MSFQKHIFGFVRKYGEGAKLVAKAVLSVIAPGSGALINIIEKACDCAQHAAHDSWEEELLLLTQNNSADLHRLGEMMLLLQGDLCKLCDNAHVFANQPDAMEDTIRNAIASDPALVEACGKLEDIAWQCQCVIEQNRRLLDGQDEMLPILRRLNRMADFFEECQAARIKPRDLGELARARQYVVAHIQQRQTGSLEPLLLELRCAVPSAASVCLLEAGAAAIDGDFPGVQKALATAARLKPNDGEIVELHRRATVLATNVTPRQAHPRNSAALRLQKGDALDGWQLVKRLGVGSWGQVFQATRDGQTRALKVMHPQYARDPIFVTHFREEIKALLRLPRHDNLVRIDDFNYVAEHGCWYLVMEYVDGPTLEQYLQARGSLTAQQVRKTFAPLADGLAQAHEAGLIHRDIKPANLIFRRSDKQLVLVDFGLAIAATDASQTKRNGTTIFFAAPEQLRCEPATASSDVYSLAATMNFALFHDKPQLRVPHRFDAAQVPELLRTVLVKALEQNPAKRYPHARAFLHDLLAETPKVSEPTASQITGLETEYAKMKPRFEEIRPQVECVVAEHKAQTESQQIAIPAFGKWRARGADKMRKPIAMWSSPWEDWDASVATPATITLKPGEYYGWDAQPETNTTFQQFVQSLSSLRTITSLYALDVWVSYADSISSEWFQGLQDLNSLRYFRSLGGVADSTLMLLRELADLEELLLMCARITDPALALLCSLKKLEKIDLSRTTITDAGLSPLRFLPKLKIVRLQDTKVTELEPIEDFPALEELHLGSTEITNNALARLRSCRSLKNLDINDCQHITATGLTYLASLPSLEELWIGDHNNRNNISEDWFAQLRYFSNLKKLTLSEIATMKPSWLTHLQRMKCLDDLCIFGSDQITDSLVAQLRNLTQLKKLSIFGSRLVSDEAKRGLERALPNCWISW